MECKNVSLFLDSYADIQWAVISLTEPVRDIYTNSIPAKFKKRFEKYFSNYRM